MGRTALIHSDAPIAELLLAMITPNEVELKYLCLLAASDETGDLDKLALPCDSSLQSLAITFNQCNAEQKRECIQLARIYLGDYISRLDDSPNLRELAQFLVQALSKASHSSQFDLIQALGKTAILRCAMINPQMAKFAFELLLAPRSLDRKKWLSLSLNAEQMIKQTTLNFELIQGPTNQDEDNEFIANLIMLYFHWPHLRDDFKKCLDGAITASIPHNAQALEDLQQTISKFTEKEFEEHFSALITTFNPIKSSHTLSLLQDIAAFTPEQLAWLCCNTYLPTPQKFRNIDKDAPLTKDLSSLIKKYGRQALLSVLQERILKEDHQAIVLQVERFYDDIISSLTFDTRRWLFLSLLLENQTKHFSQETITPTGLEYEICQQLTQTAHQCPLIMQLLHQRLSARLPGEGQQLFDLIIDFIFYSARKLSKQMRLWQYLSLSTHSEPQFFTIMGTGVHETNMANAIYRTEYSSLSAQLQRMADYSPFVRTTIYSALQENYDQSPEFERMLTRLPLYRQHSIHALLSRCEQNTLNWLYFSLLINTHQKQSLPLGGKLHIIKPQERQWLHAQQVLDLVWASNDVKNVLREIERLAQAEHIRQIRNFNLSYIQAKVKKLNQEAKSWLYYALKTLSVENSFKAANHLVLNLPTKARSDMAKICYAIANQIDLVPIVKDFLAEELPEVTALHPENDVFSFYACDQSAPGEFIYYESLSETTSLQTLPMLMKSTAKATKTWLKEALTSGVIDSSLLINSLPKEMSKEVNHELTLVPNILVLALKWPSVRAAIIQECGGDINDIKPISGVVVDKLNFSEKGMIALSLSLKSHCEHLTYVSAAQTNLNDDALVMLADTVIGHGPLESLQVHQNPALTSEALSQVLRFANERVRDEDQSFLSTTLLSCLVDPDVLSWLATRLVPSDSSMNSFLDQASFFVTKPAQDKMKSAQMIYAHCLRNPTFKAAIMRDISLLIPKEIKNNQLVYAVINSQDQDLCASTLSHLITDIEMTRVELWLSNALSTGILDISQQHLYNQKERTQIMQLCCLLLVTNRAQRFALGQKLGLSSTNIFNDIKILNIDGAQLSPILQSALIFAIHYNADTLSSITIKASEFHNDLIEPLCVALERKRKLSHLDLSANPINVNGARRIGALLTQNKHIQELDFNDCQCQEEGTIELLQHLPQTALTRLSLHHSGDCWSKYEPIRLKGTKALASALSSSTCTLTELDISHNQINNVGAKTLCDSIKKNTKLPLRTLKLNYNNLGDKALKDLSDVLDKPSLESVELDGHHAHPATLELIAEKLSNNNHINHFEARPNYVFAPLFTEGSTPMEENAVWAKDILKRIRENIKQHKAEKKLTKQFRRMNLSRSQSIEYDENDSFEFHRCASNPDLGSLQPKALTLSYDDKRKRKHKNPSDAQTPSRSLTFV